MRIYPNGRVATPICTHDSSQWVTQASGTQSGASADIGSRSPGTRWPVSCALLVYSSSLLVASVLWITAARRLVSYS